MRSFKSRADQRSGRRKCYLCSFNCLKQGLWFWSPLYINSMEHVIVALALMFHWIRFMMCEVEKKPGIKRVLERKWLIMTERRARKLVNFSISWWIKIYIFSLWWYLFIFLCWCYVWDAVILFYSRHSHHLQFYRWFCFLCIQLVCVDPEPRRKRTNQLDNFIPSLFIVTSPLGFSVIFLVVLLTRVTFLFFLTSRLSLMSAN